MKKTRMTNTELMLLVSGLLLVTSVPMLSRYTGLPDALKGFATGLGLMLEFLALAKISRRKNSCTASRVN